MVAYREEIRGIHMLSNLTPKDRRLWLPARILLTLKRSFPQWPHASYISLPVIGAEEEAGFPLLLIVLVAVGIVILVIVFTLFMRRKSP